MSMSHDEYMDEPSINTAWFPQFEQLEAEMRRQAKSREAQ